MRSARGGGACGAINPYPLLARGPGPVMARHPVPGAGPAPTPTGRDVPAEVETEAKRRARNLGVRVLREVLGKSGGPD